MRPVRKTTRSAKAQREQLGHNHKHNLYCMLFYATLPARMLPSA